MSKFELKVKILEVGETEEIGQNGFKKRDVIGTVEGENPEFHKFEFINNNTDIADDLIPGTYATITFSLKGRKVNSKKAGDPPSYFSALHAWKIDLSE